MCKSSSENKESIYNLVWTRQNKRFNGRVGGGNEEEKPTNAATRKKQDERRQGAASRGRQITKWGGWTLGQTQVNVTAAVRWRAAPLLRPMIGKASVVQVIRVRAPPGGRHRASRGVTRHVPDTLKPWQFCLSTFITILLTRLAFFHFFFLTIPNENVQRTGKQKTKQMLRFPKTKRKCPSTDVVTLVTVRNAYFVSPPLVWTASGPAAAGLVACRHFYTHVEWKLAELLRYRLVLKWRRHYWGEHHAALASV